MSYIKSKYKGLNFLFFLNQADQISGLDQYNLVNNQLKENPDSHAIILFYTGDLGDSPLLDDDNLSYRLLTVRNRIMPIKLKDYEIRDIFAIEYIDSLANPEEYKISNEVFERAIKVSSSIISAEKKIGDFINFSDERGLLLRDPPVKSDSETRMRILVVYEAILDQPSQMINSILSFYKTIEEQEGTHKDTSAFFTKPRGRREKKFQPTYVTLALGRLLLLQVIKFNSNGKIELQRSQNEIVIQRLLEDKGEAMNISELGTCFIDRTLEIKNVLLLYLSFLISKGAVKADRNTYRLVARNESDLSRLKTESEDEAGRIKELIKSWKAKDEFNGSLWNYIPNTHILASWEDIIDRFVNNLTSIRTYSPLEKVLELVIIPVTRIHKFVERIEGIIQTNRDHYDEIIEDLKILSNLEILSKEEPYENIDITLRYDIPNEKSNKVKEKKFTIQIFYFQEKVSSIKTEYEELLLEHSRASLTSERVESLKNQIEALDREHQDFKQVCENIQACWDEIHDFYKKLKTEKPIFDLKLIKYDSLDEILDEISNKLSIIEENSKSDTNVTEDLVELIGD